MRSYFVKETINKQSTMIDKYIIELLETNNRVIVPDFGAFMVKIEAGKRTITFNDFLKYNDGLLVSHVAKQEKISKDDAYLTVRHFAIELQNTLKSTQKYTFANAGTLFKDERGNYRFQNEPNTPSAGTQSTNTPSSTVRLDLTETLEKRTTAEPSKTLTNNNIKNTVEQTPPSPQQPQNPLRPAAPQQPPQQAKPNVKPGPPPPPGKGTMPGNKKGEKSKKSGLVMIIIAIVVMLAVGAGVFYLKYDEWSGKAEKERLLLEAKQREKALEEQQEREAQRIQDSIRQVEEAAKQQEMAAKQVAKQDNTKKYYLVAGSFNIENNARRFAERLRAQGYNSEVFMESHGYWRVSYNSYIDRKEAFAEYQKLKDQDIQVWVIRN